ncbi:hypothetical protein M413DRAFT_447897 [Hebeloma cylindrosporum]|uniref:Uncharacterized protein n=1 Tax=Hebeloma cylindrosporum TaxID=76867 RepID=A0A0C2YAU7_HEBCY|nr:hypothetical protein M413DRAFT_447897 [Hebeloma cylindrosporum h7]
MRLELLREVSSSSTTFRVATFRVASIRNLSLFLSAKNLGNEVEHRNPGVPSSRTEGDEEDLMH